MNSVFDPGATEVVTPLAYCKLGKDVEMQIGMDYLLLSFTPCPILKVLGFLGLTTDQSSFAELSPDVHNVTILDARKQNLGGFHETGFTLIQLEKEPETKDWRKHRQPKDQGEGRVCRHQEVLRPDGASHHGVVPSN